MAGNAVPLKVYKVVGAGDAQPRIMRKLEEASQTFKMGTPLKSNSSGYMIAWAANANNSSGNIAGVATEPGSNLASNGTPKTLTYGSVPMQANASIVPVGAPPNDGTVGILVAESSTIFVGKCNDAHNIAVTDVGRQGGLTYDTNGFPIVETEANNATANGACLIITELVDAVGTAGGKVAFRFLDSAQQLGGRATA